MGLIEDLASSIGIDPSALGSILSGAGGVGAAVLQQNQLNKGTRFIQDQQNRSTGQNQYGTGKADIATGAQNSTLSGLLNGNNPYSQKLTGLMDQQGGMQGTILPGLVRPGQNLSQFNGMPQNQVYQDPNAAAAQAGMNPLIAQGGAINRFGQGTLDNQGLTPALQAALQQSMGITGSGGQTGLNTALAKRGMDLASGNPLLSMGNAASFAQDQAGRNFANAARSGRTNAALRGQGPGSVVASGAGNSALADNSDAALAGNATAVQQALTGQQGLGLQQLAQGLNTGLSSAQLQNALVLGGLNSTAGLTNAQTSQGGLGLNAATQGTNIQSQTLQQQLQNLLQGQTGSANIGQKLAELLLQNQGQQQTSIGTGLNTTLGASGQLGTQTGQYLGYGGDALRAASAGVNAMADLSKQPNAISQVVNNLAGAAAKPQVSAGPAGPRNPFTLPPPAGTPPFLGSPPQTYDPATGLPSQPTFGASSNINYGGIVGDGSAGSGGFNPNDPSTWGGQPTPPTDPGGMSGIGDPFAPASSGSSMSGIGDPFASGGGGAMDPSTYSFGA